MTGKALSITIGGMVVEVGRSSSKRVDDSENEVVLEISRKDAQYIRIVGISDSVTKFLSQNLYSDMIVTFEIA